MAVMSPSAVVDAPSNPNVVSMFRRRLGLPPLATGGGQGTGSSPTSRPTGPVKCLFGAPDVRESQALSKKIEERASWSFSRKWNFNITGKEVAPAKLESSNPEGEAESVKYEWILHHDFDAKTPTLMKTPTPPSPVVTVESPNSNVRCLRIRNGHSGSRIMKQRAITEFVQVRKGVFKNKKKSQQFNIIPSIVYQENPDTMLSPECNAILYNQEIIRN